MVALAFLQQSNQALGWLLILGMALLCSADSLGWHWAHSMAVVGNHWVFAASIPIYLRAKLFESSESTGKGFFAVTFLKYCKNPAARLLVRYICVISERIHFSLTGGFTAHKNRTSELSRALWMVWACDTSALQQRWKGARGSEWHGGRSRISEQNQTNNCRKCRQQKSTLTHAVFR